MDNIIPSVSNIYGKITDISLQKNNYSYNQLFETLISENKNSKTKNHIQSTIIIENIKQDINDLINENNEWKKIIYNEIINEKNNNEKNNNEIINKHITIQNMCVLKDNNKVINGRNINDYEDIINLIENYNENMDIINNIEIDSKNIIQIIMKKIQRDFLGKRKKDPKKLEKLIYQEIYNQLKFYIIYRLSSINLNNIKKEWAKNALEYTELKYSGSNKQTIEKTFKEKKISVGRDSYFGSFIDELLSLKHTEINSDHKLVINKSEGINEENIYIDDIINFQKRCKAIIQDNNYIEYQEGKKILYKFGEKKIDLSKK